MRRRLGRRCLLAGALVACMLLADATPGAIAGERSRFAGKTAQGYRLHLEADRRHAVLIRVKVKLRCRNGGLLFDDLSDFEPAALRRNGRFSDIQFGPSDEVLWRGRVSGRRVRGSIRVKDRLKSGVRCDSGIVGFSARRVGG